jgi:hypothetical protein
LQGSTFIDIITLPESPGNNVVPSGAGGKRPLRVVGNSSSKSYSSSLISVTKIILLDGAERCYKAALMPFLQTNHFMDSEPNVCNVDELISQKFGCNRWPELTGDNLYANGRTLVYMQQHKC